MKRRDTGAYTISTLTTDVVRYLIQLYVTVAWTQHNCNAVSNSPRPQVKQLIKSLTAPTKMSVLFQVHEKL